MVAHVCNPNIQKVRTGGSGFQGHPGLRSKFKASLGYRRPAETEIEREMQRHRGIERQRCTERWSKRDRDAEYRDRETDFTGVHLS